MATLADFLGQPWTVLFWTGVGIMALAPFLGVAGKATRRD